jgi:hypothetical protein
VKIDVKNFKKIECDDHCTTLQHPNGHTIKIAHKGLSKEYKKQLDEIPMQLAKGGKVDPHTGSKASKPSKSSNTMPGSPTEAKDNYTESNAMGTYMPKEMLQQEMNSKHQPDVVLGALNRTAPPLGPMSADASQHYPPCINPSCKSYGRSHPNCRCYGGNPEGSKENPGYFANGGTVDGYCSTNRAHDKGCAYYYDGTKDGPVNNNDIVPDTAKGPIDNNDIVPATAEIPEKQQAPQGSSEQPAAVSVPDAPQAPQPSAPQDDQLQLPPDDPVQAGMYHAKAVNDHLMNEDAQVKADINSGAIKPETYADIFNNKSTLGKIGSIFGFLLSGAGSGLAHQSNAFLGMMDNQIKNDLALQTSNQSNRQNLLKINQQNLANNAHINLTDEQANQIGLANEYMAKNRVAFDSLTKKVMSYPEGSPLRVQGEQVLTMMSPMIDKQNYSIASKAALASALNNQVNGKGGSSQNTTAMKSGLMGPEMKEVGEDVESKSMPGFSGRAAAPMQPGEKDELRKGAEFTSAMNDLTSWVQAHPNGAIPGSPEDQRGRALAGIVQGKFREATNGGVYKSGEQDFINKLVPEDPSKSFNAYRVLPRVQAVQKEMLNQLNAKARGYGFKGYSGGQTQNQGSSQQIKTVNGKKYKRGPNGEAIEVH